MTRLTMRLRRYAARAEDFEHPDGWLSAVPSDLIETLRLAADEIERVTRARDEAERERDRLRFMVQGILR